MTRMVDAGSARTIATLFLLACVVLMTPTPRRKASPGRMPASVPHRRRGLLAGLGLASAGLLVLPHGWPLVIPAAIGGGLAVGRQARLADPGRSARIVGELAVRLDLIASCLRSGLGVGPALAAVETVLPIGDHRAGSDDPAVALHRVGLLLALGAEPAAAWRPAQAYPDLVPVAAAACRTAVGGTVLVSALTEQSTVLRARLATLGAERAGRAGVLIAAPLGLCFLPSFLCLGLAPVVIGLLGELRLPS